LQASKLTIHSNTTLVHFTPLSISCDPSKLGILIWLLPHTRLPDHKLHNIKSQMAAIFITFLLHILVS
jgi:hypothetical protein